MLPDKKTKTIIGVGIGFILQIAGRVLAASSKAGAVLGLILMWVGAACFLWGGINYAEGKRHSKWPGSRACFVASASSF
jgi:threonine/homoserine/homoserine lactone efflux protein